MDSSRNRRKTHQRLAAALAREPRLVLNLGLVILRGYNWQAIL
jgi:hypothetical protein